MGRFRQPVSEELRQQRIDRGQYGRQMMRAELSFDEPEPGPGDPTPEEVRAACEQIQTTWDEVTRQARTTYPEVEPVNVMQCTLHQRLAPSRELFPGFGSGDK